MKHTSPSNNTKL